MWSTLMRPTPQITTNISRTFHHSRYSNNNCSQMKQPALAAFMGLVGYNLVKATKNLSTK